MIRHLLFVTAKRDRIRPAFYGFCISFLQCIQKPGCFWYRFLHMIWKDLRSIAIILDLKRLCLKWFDPFMTDCYDLWLIWIIGYLNMSYDQLGFRFLFRSLVADAATFINFTDLMMTEDFPDNRCIKKCQRSCVTIEFL